MAQNRLAQETSPYLRQHQDNPVDWYPWGPAAFERAKAENKPIMLSVGYAACHWCHVMAHESFESPEIAESLNKHFVNIKVDREERPDLDQLYQTALALMGQHGGWPLTMFLTPEGEPFWGGTYFPNESKWGQPGFPQVIEKVSEIYHHQPELITDNRQRLKDALNRLYSAEATPGDVPESTLDSAAEQLLGMVDWKNGGTQGAPKFPQPYLFDLLWRAYKRAGTRRAYDAVLLSLRQMSEGGIYDHLGGGYARYSVDDHWLVPHFEKMLYDNGQILDLLVHAWRETRDPIFKDRAYETVGWLLREMRTENGAFAASLDADSEGEEGKFYVWDAAEIDRILGDDAALFKEVYDVRPGGNWEGKTILNRLSAPESVSEADETALATARAALFAERENRVRPRRDDKILADWNGLVIGPLAEAGAAFGEESWIAAAEAAFAFIAETMGADENGRSKLYHGYCEGRRQETAVLDDYANMAAAALRLFEVTGRDPYLEKAKAWTATAKDQFGDAETGGFYLSPADADDMFLRPLTATDHAIPNGNGTMAQVLVKLYHLTLAEEYRRDAESVIRAFGDTVQRQPMAFASLLNGLDDLLHGPQITLIGESQEIAAWKTRIFDQSVPGRALMTVPEAAAIPDDHPAADKAGALGGAGAFVCRGTSCSLPITESEALVEALSPQID